jgi:hypothetical protein
MYVQNRLWIIFFSDSGKHRIWPFLVWFIPFWSTEWWSPRSFVGLPIFLPKICQRRSGWFRMHEMHPGLDEILKMGEPQVTRGWTILPSGKHTKNYGKSPFVMGKSTISMAIFNSFLLVYQRVNCSTDLDDARGYPHDLGKPAYPAYWDYSMVCAGSWRQDKRHLVPGMSWNNLLGPPQFCL